MVEKAKAGNEVRRTPFDLHPKVFLKLFVKKCAHDVEVLERHVPALGQPHASCKHGAAVDAVVGDPHAR